MDSSEAMEDEEGSGGAVEGVVNLGYLEEEAEAALLESHHLFGAGKVGGRPAWLAMSPLPSPAQLLCGTCERPLSFLLQVYAPVGDGAEDAFHRSLFLFVCRNGACACVRAFRSQLPRHNPFYAADPLSKEELAGAKRVEDFSALCFVCGGPGGKKCGRCQKASYCDKLHQALHWKAGHKQECVQEAPVEPAAVEGLGKGVLFPQAGLVIEEEELEEGFDPETAFAEDCEAEEDVREAGGGVDELEGLESTADPVFEAFKARLAQNPEQVVRYERRGRPLWASRALPKELPPCGLCGAPRVFEFQVMPELLLHLAIDELAKGSLDFATLAVFTCQASCSLQDKGYAQEFAFMQLYQ